MILGMGRCVSIWVLSMAFFGYGIREREISEIDDVIYFKLR